MIDLPEPDSRQQLDETAYRVFAFEYRDLDSSCELPEAEPLWQHAFYFGYMYRIAQENQARIKAGEETIKPET